MRKAVATLIGALSLFLLLTTPALAYGPGDQARLQGTDSGGTQRSLGDYRDRVVVVVFWGSQCPSSRGYAARLQALANRFGRDAQFLGVASNGYDDANQINQGKNQQGINFPVLVDQGGALARAFRAQVTPTVYVIDGQGVVRYKGAIDDDPSGNNPRAHYLRDAIQAVVGGNAPAQATTNPRGCRIAS
jgi:thiol-disulfide isomerase/thioredoxin